MIAEATSPRKGKSLGVTGRLSGPAMALGAERRNYGDYRIEKKISLQKIQLFFILDNLKFKF